MNHCCSCTIQLPSCSMSLEKRSRQELLKFVTTLASSGCESIGPQCTYISDIADNDNSLLLSKAVAEVLEVKYGSRSSYAPALVDFLSSHQSFFGTVRLHASLYMHCILSLMTILTESIPYHSFHM